MKQFLLDTHAFLWWLDDNPKLSKAARAVLRDATSLIHVSAASIWEIAIKSKLDKIEVVTHDRAFQAYDVSILAT